ncbi:MAG TPA: hypothetical protein VER58_13155 [Thermoanaerobaculia bacterium]|nr:hypothetical protein [Thermoanaerobaculia bacterium]
MPRRLVCLCLLLIAAGAFAQERRGIARPPVSSSFLGPIIDRIDADSRLKTANVRRDAFIVSQVVAAVGALEDFQRNAAMEKARDHVEAAIKRARENPVAPRQTFELLDKLHDLIDKARQQGATADFPSLKRDLMRQNHFLQQILFNELDDVRKDRQALSDLQSRLSSMTNDIDNALGEALGATFDYFRAGGQ